MGRAGRHHARPDAGGRRVVHGLLTATIPTRIGGNLDYLARERFQRRGVALDVEA